MKFREREREKNQLEKGEKNRLDLKKQKKNTIVVNNILRERVQ